MIPTPDVSHLSREDWLHVYEPAEDTFALLDALEQDAEVIRATHPRLVVEIGSGSGTVSAFVAALLADYDSSGCSAAFICTDINAHAAAATKATGERNGGRAKQAIEADTVDTPRRQHGIHLAPVLTPMLDALRPRCKGLIDLLLFNPPYVPTTDEEEAAAQSQRHLAGSWAGGTYGTALVEQLLPDLETLLAPGGRFYLVAVRQNEPEALVKRMQSSGLEAGICLSRRAGREHLFILRAVKPM